MVGRDMVGNFSVSLEPADGATWKNLSYTGPGPEPEPSPGPCPSPGPGLDPSPEHPGLSSQHWFAVIKLQTWNLEL